MQPVSHHRRHRGGPRLVVSPARSDPSAPTHARHGSQDWSSDRCFRAVFSAMVDLGTHSSQALAPDGPVTWRPSRAATKRETPAEREVQAGVPVQGPFHRGSVTEAPGSNLQRISALLCQKKSGILIRILLRAVQRKAPFRCRRRTSVRRGPAPTALRGTRSAAARSIDAPVGNAILHRRPPSPTQRDVYGRASLSEAGRRRFGDRASLASINSGPRRAEVAAIASKGHESLKCSPRLQAAPSTSSVQRPRESQVGDRRGFKSHR